MYFLEGTEKQQIAHETLLALAWAIKHHLKALSKVEKDPSYLEKATQIADILLDGNDADE